MVWHEEADFSKSQEIMTEAFRLALNEARTGIVVVTTLGLHGPGQLKRTAKGVWEAYWQAFFDAVKKSQDTLELIVVNPLSKWEGTAGLVEKHIEDPELRKKIFMINSQNRTPHPFYLAEKLKQTCPHTKVSLISNAPAESFWLKYRIGEVFGEDPNNSAIEQVKWARKLSTYGILHQLTQKPSTITIGTK